MALIGRYDRRAEVQRWTSSSVDSSGQEVGSWSTVAACWAERRYQSGQERLEASRTTAMQSELFRLRGDVAVTVKDRLVCDGLTYDIVSVAEIGRNEGREIVATARADT